VPRPEKKKKRGVKKGTKKALKVKKARFSQISRQKKKKEVKRKLCAGQERNQAHEQVVRGRVIGKPGGKD